MPIEGSSDEGFLLGLSATPFQNNSAAPQSCEISSTSLRLLAHRQLLVCGKDYRDVSLAMEELAL